MGAGRGRPGRRPGPRHRALGRCGPARRPRLHRRRWTCAAPKPSARWRGTSCLGPQHRRTSRPRLRAAKWCCTCTSPRTRSRHRRRAAPGPGGEHPLVRRRRPGPRLVRPARHQGDGEAGGRPHRARPCEPVRGPRPARRPGSRAGPDLCVPVVPRPAEACDLDHVIPYAEGGPPAATTSEPCVVGTTGSRPTTPAGATPSSNPGPTCGPHRTATSSCATTAAPPTSPATGHRTRPTSSDPAPHPAPTLPARGHRHVSGRISRPAPTSPTPACEHESRLPPARHPVTAAGGERKGWRGGDSSAQPQRRPPPTRHPPATAGGGRRGPRGASPRAPDA